MTISPHTVEPEKVMALLDGELSASDAQDVAVHIDSCSQCARLAERLRGASHLLSGWKVPTMPGKIEESITDLVADIDSHGIAKSRRFTHRGFWTWKRWAIVSAGSVAGLFLILNILNVSMPTLRRPQQTAMPGRFYQESQQREGEGSAGKFQVGKPISDKKSKVPLSGLVARATPGVAVDSNGLHGLGDHAQSSSSLDGEPMTDEQGEVFSNFTAPLIARTVSLSIVVKDFSASRSSLDAILRRHHGYSAQLNVSTPEDAPRGLQASLRVPAPDLSAAIGDLKTLGRIESESQAGEEVTKQHTDLVARLKNSRDTEQRFRAILQQHTGNVGEVLQVEEGIARVRGDIERMEAEQKALEHRVDFSIVELQLTEEYRAQLNPPATSVSTRINNAFVAGYHNAVETVLGVILFFAQYSPSALALLIVLVLPMILLWRRYRRVVNAV